MLASTYRRAAAPVLLAFGHKIEDGRLHAGLLFISAQLDAQPYHLSDPDTNQRVTVHLPRELVDLSDDTMKTNATLEVAP